MTNPKKNPPNFNMSDELPTTSAKHSPSIPPQAPKLQHQPAPIPDMRLEEILGKLMKTIQSQHEAPLSRVHPDPKPFDAVPLPGISVHERLEQFTAGIKVKFTVNADHFKTKAEKAYYIYSLLEGQAQDLVTSKYEEYTGPQHIIDDLRKLYGEPDPEYYYQRQLHRMKQGNRPFSLFYSDFSRCARKTGHNDVTLKFYLREAISEELSTRLNFSNMKDMTLTELSDYCTTQDTQMRAMISNRKHAARSRPSVIQSSQSTPQRPLFRSMTSTPATRPPPVTAQDSAYQPPRPQFTPAVQRPAPTPLPAPAQRHTAASSLAFGRLQHSSRHDPHYDPMNTSRPRITPEERARRLKGNLCFYCGEDGHRAITCRNRGPRIAAVEELVGQGKFPEIEEEALIELGTATSVD